MDDIEKFDKFLSSYVDFYQPVSEISMPCAYHDRECPSIKQKECTSKSKVPLVDSDFMMYSFDDIIRHVKTIDICNLPSTVDGLYLDKKRKILYFIEFKGVQIDKSRRDIVIPCVDYFCANCTFKLQYLFAKGNAFIFCNKKFAVAVRHYQPCVRYYFLHFLTCIIFRNGI